MKVSFDHIVLNVNDVERALRFYMDVIGLPGERIEAFRAGEVPFPSVRVNADTLIDLMPPALWGGPSEERGDNVDHFCLAFDKSDWPALEARLERAGVDFELGPATLWGAHGNGTSVYIRDSEGNRVELRYYD